MNLPRHSLVDCALAAVICLLLPLLANAQNFSIDWHKVAGGGGTSSNGQYAVSGTIGQHDASSPMTGGNFSLTGGFWALSVIQTAGSPLLTIVATPTNTVMVSWPSPSTGFRLQQTIDLNTDPWTTPSEPINDDGTVKFVVVNPPLGNRFYRLVKP
jgi:hypothetical protein